MREITLEELLEAGCHFGHQVTRHNPKSKDFVFESRDNIHIIDLAKTKEGLQAAAQFIKDVAARSKESTLFLVGTKRQAKSIIEEEFKRAKEALKNNSNIFFVTNRWIGGTLTNFTEVAKNAKKLKQLEENLQNEEEKEKYTKKEIGAWEKERQKLETMYGGMKDMEKKPDVIFIIDSHLEDLTVREARATHIPTVAIVDTNADPSVIDFPVPANDDAVGSITLITNYILDAWIEGKKQDGVKKEEKKIENSEQKEEKKKNPSRKTKKKEETTS